MERVKQKVYLTDQLYAVLTMKLEMPPAQRDLAEALGTGPQEQQNLLGQRMAELLQLMGNTDET